jgi:hypothetical protein
MYEIMVQYPIPFFSEYTIEFPEYYKGDYKTRDIVISRNGKIVKENAGSWKLKNPESDTPEYDKFYNKNVVGTMTQTLYKSDIICIYNHITKENKKKISSEMESIMD